MALRSLVATTTRSRAYSALRAAAKVAAQRMIFSSGVREAEAAVDEAAVDEATVDEAAANAAAGVEPLAV